LDREQLDAVEEALSQIGSIGKNGLSSRRSGATIGCQ
jgi:hypothetical protein